jgi:FKBP-type peptidyl-prolyl cis-trans isomerase 2
MKRILAGFALVTLILDVTGCAPAIVSKNKMVDVAYKGTLSDGSVFAQSEPSKPLEFLVGANSIIPDLEKAMLGMKVGDKKTVVIKAVDAYGEYDKAAVREVPRSQFPKDVDLKIGAHYQVSNGQGGKMVLTVSAMTDTTVTIDFNHPLAGKDLTFEVTIVKIRDATKTELAKMPAQAPAAGSGQGQTTQK